MVFICAVISHTFSAAATAREIYDSPRTLPEAASGLCNRVCGQILLQTKIKNFPRQAGLHSEAAVADNTTPAHPLEYQPRLSLAIAERITVAGIEKQRAERSITLRYCRVSNPPLMVVI